VPSAAEPAARPAIRRPLSDPNRPIRVALVGCGAVSKANLLPVLAGHSRVTLSALVDRDEGRARALADAYGVRTVLSDIDALSPSDVDAVVLATPPAHHAPATIALVGRGLHVLVEKPMAITGADAAQMVEAADTAGVALGVGLYRRMLPAVQLLKTLVARGDYGRPLSAELEEGGSYGWQLATLAVLTRAAGGGGVLIDIGSHVVDVLLHVLPGAASLTSFADNARGGIETDCLATFTVTSDGRPIPVRLELSRTRELGNTIRVHCERATLELRRANFIEVFVYPTATTGRPASEAAPLCLSADWPGKGAYIGYQAFRDEIDDWLGAIVKGTEPELSGRSVVPVVQLIEACYANRTDLAEPWTDEGFKTVDGSRLATMPAAKARRVLVTGAGGFLGGRAVELLRARHGWDVVALIREPKSAARLARWPTEIALGDICSPADMDRAVRGCDAVVHCAVGTSWMADETRRVTVDGTRIVAEAALRAGVKRFVHISTMFVHRRDLGGTLDEQVALEPPASDDYGQNKLRAEQALGQVAQRGLSTIVIRPTRIYGPFSRTFTVRPLQALSTGHLILTGDPDVPGNMVYVDNVVEAIARALDAPAALGGSAYLVTDPEQLTLRQFYQHFGNAAGTTVRVGSMPARVAAPTPGFFGRWAGGVRAIVLSPELRGMIKRIINTEPIGTWPRRFWDTSPKFQGRALKLFGVDTADVYRPAAGEGEGDLPYYGESARVSSAKAEREIGYQVAVSHDRAMALTLAWAEEARLLRSGRP
jgi:predicted dehydrogenase/nucleoside-diphosphate-sugar epimerase